MAKIPSMMRSVVLGDYGDSDVLHFQDQFPVPEIKGVNVLVNVRACALGLLDTMVRHGDMDDVLQLKSRKEPYVMGYEVSGVVERVGALVPKEYGISVGDEVVAICPIDEGNGGYADYISQPYYRLIKKPVVVTHAEAAGCLGPAVRAYSAMRYKMGLVAGQSILILDGASDWGHIAVQLALLWGARVFTTGGTDDQINYLRDLSSEISCGLPSLTIINTQEDTIMEVIMKETGGSGVDFILDGCRPSFYANRPIQSPKPESPKAAPAEPIPAFASLSLLSPSPSPDLLLSQSQEKEEKERKKEEEERERFSLPFEACPSLSSTLSTREALSLLGVHGVWVTGSSLFLSPSDSRIAHRKSLTVSFLFDQTWILGGTQHGRFLHILSDVMENLSQEKLKPRINGIYKLEKVQLAHQFLTRNTVGRVVLKMEPAWENVK